MPISRLDTAYRSLVLSKFFKKGWGKPENLKKLFEFRKIVSKRETCFPLVDTDHPVTITKETNSSDSILLEGQFLSPFEQHLPGLLPQISQTAYFQVLVPKKWQSSHYKPVCLHLAGTGDHVCTLFRQVCPSDPHHQQYPNQNLLAKFFFRRRNLLAKPLLREAGIGALLLENPFYGLRKPKDQRWSALHNVSDIFVMGGCLILESLVLFHWCKRNGFGPFGLTGISMGGHMASLAATNIPEPIVLVPCLSWTTASGVFTRGVMSTAINWELLEHQYFTDESYCKEIKHMVKIIDNHECFAAGQHFAKNYPESLDEVEKIENRNSQGEVEAWGQVTQPNGSIGSEGMSYPEKKAGGSEVGQGNYSVQALKNATDEPESLESNRTFTKAKNKVSDYFSRRDKRSEKQKEDDNVGDGKKTEKEKQEALQFMCGIMDECTHLKNFSVPVDTELIISVTAKDDAYVPRDGFTNLQDLWRGSEIRYLNSGHIGAFLLHQKFFRSAITDAFDRFKSKYYKCDSKTAEINSKHLSQ